MLRTGELGQVLLTRFELHPVKVRHQGGRSHPKHTGRACDIKTRAAADVGLRRQNKEQKAPDTMS